MTSPDDPRFSDDEHSSSNLRFAISMCCQLLNGTTSHANYTLLNIYKTAAPRLALANKLTMGQEPVWSRIWIFKPLTFSRCILNFHNIKKICDIIRPKDSKCDFIDFITLLWNPRVGAIANTWIGAIRKYSSVRYWIHHHCTALTSDAGKLAHRG